MNRTQVKSRKNEEIRIREVRLTGSNVENGIMSTKQALEIANNMGMDLVEVNSQPTPSICKIMNYDKFLYEEKKKVRDLSKKQKESSKKPKEIRLGPNIGDHDLTFKSKQAAEFLNKGHKVYVNILFKGRAIIHKERGEIILLKFASLLEDNGIVEKLPTLQGRKMGMNIKPIKNN